MPAFLENNKSLPPPILSTNQSTNPVNEKPSEDSQSSKTTSVPTSSSKNLNSIMM